MFVPKSKFRHTFGCPAKKEQCYEGLKVTSSAHDGSFCAVNPMFLAVVVESAGGGVFVVLPLEKTGRVDINTPKVCGHRGLVTDIKWNPFDDHVIASASDDATIKVWQIPEGGLKENLTDCMADLHGHSKRVSYIEWHPTAANILLSAGFDFQCILWNTRTQTACNVINVHHDTIFSMSWNHDGSLFATTCKDRMIRIIDPRTGNIVVEGEGHQGSKASKVIFLRDQDRLFTTGFSRSSERQFSVWSINKSLKAIKTEDVDSSSGVLLPFYDQDIGVIYLVGKGDGNIRYFEIIDNEPYVYFLNQYQSPSPQRGVGFMPKLGVDTSKCEIGRFYKLHTLKDICEPISMIVPRKSEMFQSDIFPPTAGVQPSLTSEQWLNGQNRGPVLVSLQAGSTSSSIIRTESKAVTSALNEQNTNHKGGLSDSFQRSNNRFQERQIEKDVPTQARDTFGSSLQMGNMKTTSNVKYMSSEEVVTSAGNGNKHWPEISSNGTSHMTSNMTNHMTSNGSSLKNQQDVRVNEIASINSQSPRPNSTHQTVQSRAMPRLQLAKTFSVQSEGSEFSDVPVTPVTPVSRPGRRRRRRQDDSSSCSSTEAVDQITSSTWQENPLYSQTKSPSGRRKNVRSHSKESLLQLNRAATVDVGPLDDVLNAVATGDAVNLKTRQMSKSSCDLINADLARNLPLGNGSSFGNGTGSDTFLQPRSEPDVLAAIERATNSRQEASIQTRISDSKSITIKENKNFEDEQDEDSLRTTMIDCISVEAPDDTLIKPSKLRASMSTRQKRGNAVGIVGSMSTGDIPTGELKRAGSLRESKSSQLDKENHGSFQRRTFVTGSMRELKKSDNESWSSNKQRDARVVYGTTSNVADKELWSSTNNHKDVRVVYGTTSSTANNESWSANNNNYNRDAKVAIETTSNADSNVKYAPSRLESSESESQSSARENRSRYNLSNQVVSNQQQGKMALLPNHFVFSVPIRRKEVVHAGSGDSEERRSHRGDPTSLSHQDLLDKYFQQQEEIKKLRLQVVERDSKIRLLEERLRCSRFTGQQQILV